MFFSVMYVLVIDFFAELGSYLFIFDALISDSSYSILFFDYSNFYINYSFSLFIFFISSSVALTKFSKTLIVLDLIWI